MFNSFLQLQMKLRVFETKFDKTDAHFVKDQRETSFEAADEITTVTTGTARHAQIHPRDCCSDCSDCCSDCCSDLF